MLKKTGMEYSLVSDHSEVKRNMTSYDSPPPFPGQCGKFQPIFLNTSLTSMYFLQNRNSKNTQSAKFLVSSNTFFWDGYRWNIVIRTKIIEASSSNAHFLIKIFIAMILYSVNIYNIHGKSQLYIINQYPIFVEISISHL